MFVAFWLTAWRYPGADLTLHVNGKEYKSKPLEELMAELGIKTARECDTLDPEPPRIPLNVFTHEMSKRNVTDIF